MEKTIYLDNAATTFPKPQIVYERMDEVNRTLAVNAGRGSYRLAQEANKIIDDTKVKLLELIGARELADVVLTPSVTIALNQILQGIKLDSTSNIYVSPYEHNAVARTINFLQKRSGFKVFELPLKEESLEIDIDKMIYMFDKNNPTCVCVIGVSNVTGYILPFEKIFCEAKKYSAITIMDAAQALGLIKIEYDNINADFIAFAGHKTLYGPFGIAGFYIRKGISLKEVIVGGTGSNSLNLDMPNSSPQKFESASPNIVAIAGLNAALDVLNVEEIFLHERTMSEYLIAKIEKIKGLKLYLPQDRKSHISIISFNISKYTSADVGMILDEDYGIAVRTGYHCAPFIHKYLQDEKELGTVRIGISRFSVMEEINILVEAINNLCEDM